MRTRSTAPFPNSRFSIDTVVVRTMAMTLVGSAVLALPVAGTVIADATPRVADSTAIAVLKNASRPGHKRSINALGNSRTSSDSSFYLPSVVTSLPYSVTRVVPPETAYPEIRYTKTVVHVRSGPSTEYGVTRTLLKGAKVTVVASKMGWNADKRANVSWSKLATGGWICTDLLTTAGAPLNQTGGEAKSTKFGPVNVRSGPSTEYGIIKQLDAGTEVTVTATKRGWSATDNSTVNWSKISGGGWIVSYALQSAE